MCSSLDALLKIPERPRLNSEEVDKVKGYMRDLRSLGFTNKEVSQLCQGRWSEATVKKYTRGVEVSSVAEKEHVIELITEHPRPL